MRKKVLSLNVFGLMALVFLNEGVYATNNDKQIIENNTLFPNSTGSSATFSTNGFIDKNNEFFQSLGTNDRSCVTCHQMEEGWSVSPKGIQKRFNTTSGKDAIFRINDGSNSPKAKVSTIAARRSAYSMLLNKGVFRIGLKMPKNSEFELVNVSNPYDSVSPKDINADFEFSLFRRPLPATNLKFLSAVMWDGRETISGQTISGRTIQEDLGNQADNATIGHAQGNKLTALQRQHIVDFETALFTTQVYDKKAKNLTTLSSTGDLTNLSEQNFYNGINDFFSDSKTELPPDSRVFNLFDDWNGLIASNPTDIRAAIARGQQLFNTKPITISNVSGLFGTVNVIVGTCGTCHNTPNVGSHSVARFFNLGISDESRRTADMPLYTLRNKATGETVKTTDPGRGLITGNWKHIGRFKVPTLRGLAARPPYFHNGMAKGLGNVLDFYDQRFHIGFDNRERLDLIAFLSAL